MTDPRHDADTLARFLDGDGSLNGQVTGETRALARLAHCLEDAAVEPRPSRRQELRDELLEAARERQTAPALRTRLRRRLAGASPRGLRAPGLPRLAAGPRLAAVLGAAIIAVSGSGLAYAAEASLPGDMLYSTKLAAEDVRMAFVDNPSVRGVMHLDRAAERISEARHAAEGWQEAATAVALRHAHSSARAGAGAILRSYQSQPDPELIDRLATFTNAQTGRVSSLAGTLRGEAAAAAADTLVAFEQIKAQATALGGACPECEEAASTPAGSSSEDADDPTPGQPSETPGGPQGPEPPSRPVQPDTSPPATPPQGLESSTPSPSTPDITPPEPPAEAPTTTPETPDADDAPIDPPDPEKGTPDDLVPDRLTPDLPF